MQKLGERHGAQAIERALRFTSIRLRSRTETAEIADEVDEMRQRVREVSEEYAQQREERLAASAEVQFLDSEVDRAVADIVRRALDLVENNHEDPRFVSIFPPAPTATNPAPHLDQDHHVRSICARIAKDPDLAELLEPARALAADIDELATAVLRRNALFVPERKAATDRDLVLQAARDLYNALYPRLLLQFPDQEMLVESFFTEIRRSKPPGAVGDD